MSGETKVVAGSEWRKKNDGGVFVVTEVGRDAVRLEDRHVGMWLSFKELHDGFEPAIPDPVDNPPHYKGTAVEPIDAIEAWGLGFVLGNVIKYVARAGRKGDRLEDLRKAKFYLDRAIEKGAAE
jgi:hypothetical protein